MRWWRSSSSSSSSHDSRHLSVLTLNSTQEQIHSLNEDEVQELIANLDRIERDIRVIRSRLRGDDFLRRPKSNPVLKPWLTNNLLLLTGLWQILSIALLAALTGDDQGDDNSDQSIRVDVPVGIMMFFTVSDNSQLDIDQVQGLHLIFITVVSVKLAKQVLHRTVSGWFMVQCYCSTLILFGNIYALMYRVSPATFQGLYPQSSETKSNIALLITFLQCQYFSVACMTTVGFGEIHPSSWPSYIVVSVEMLLSVIYTTVIFAKGLSHFSQRATKKKKHFQEPVVSGAPQLYYQSY